MPTVAEARKRLKGIEGHVAVAIWQREDVLRRAKDNDIEITTEQADEIIDQIDRRHDCTVGINWDVLDYYIDDHLRSRTYSERGS